MTDFTTRSGRLIRVLGQADLLTLERMEVIGSRFDADPRIATISLVPGSVGSTTFQRATAPAGPVTCAAEDLDDVVGPIPEGAPDPWFAAASNRGFDHEWWIVSAPDVRASLGTQPAEADSQEQRRPSSQHALHEFSRGSTGMSLAIDISWLGPHETGAQVLTTAATRALADHSGVSRISLRGSDALPAYAEHLLTHPKITLGGDDVADVCWFPNQIDFRSNLGAARQWGRRVITTYLDLIAYSIPRYHASEDAWLAYRSLQRTSALASDGVTTISADVAQRLMQEVPLVDPMRVRPIPLGMDHIRNEQVPVTPPTDVAPVVDAIGDRPFILVLGNDFLHKNRDFAISVWQELLRSGVQCDLVLAGLHVRGSSSKVEEAAALARHVDLRGRAHVLEHVSGGGRTWLLAHAAAVIYPSSAEGFGFVPYEAATLGTPSTFTRFGPLAEISHLSDVPARWTVAEYVSDLRALMTDQAAAHRRIAGLTAAAELHSWALFADRLVSFMREIEELPIVPAGAVLAETAHDAAALNALLASRTWRALAPVRRAGRILRRTPRE